MYKKFVTFPWPTVESALSIFNIAFLSVRVFEKELIKTKEIAISAES
jgi:hypothetical protein